MLNKSGVFLNSSIEDSKITETRIFYHGFFKCIKLQKHLTLGKRFKCKMFPKFAFE